MSRYLLRFDNVFDIDLREIAIQTAVSVPQIVVVMIRTMMLWFDCSIFGSGTSSHVLQLGTL